MILTLFLRTAIDGCIAAAGFPTGALPASTDEAASLAEDDIDLFLADMRLHTKRGRGEVQPSSLILSTWMPPGRDLSCAFHRCSK